MAILRISENRLSLPAQISVREKKDFCMASLRKQDDYFLANALDLDLVSNPSLNQEKQFFGLRFLL